MWRKILEIAASVGQSFIVVVCLTAAVVFGIKDMIVPSVVFAFCTVLSALFLVAWILLETPFTQEIAKNSFVKKPRENSVENSYHGVLFGQHVKRK